MNHFSAFLRTYNYVKFSRCVLIWPPIPARKPKSKSPGSASTVNGGAANKKTRAQRLVRLRTTLTGADEPYNGRGGSRHDHLIHFTLLHQRTAHNFHLCITFLLELSAAAGLLPLGFHRGELSLGDGMLADPRGFAFESCLADFRGWRVAAGGETC